MLYTDAAVIPGWACEAYVSSSGLYGLVSHPQPRFVSGPQEALVAELRAVYEAVKKTRAAHPNERITIRTDSPDALRHLKAWAADAGDLPRGYGTTRLSGNPSSLEKLQAVMLYDRALTCERVIGHSGDPFNELADSLAKLGVRHARGNVDDSCVADLARQWVTVRLDDTRRT